MTNFDATGAVERAPSTVLPAPVPRPAASPRPARSPWLVFALLAAIQFLVVLDTSIVYVALPSIDRDLGFSATGLVWVMNAYILAFGGLMLVGGRAADLFGRRRVLFLGMILFGVASLACGLSVEAWQIVAGRAVQGLAAAIVAPAALALVTDVFKEGPDRYKALGIFGGIGGVAGAAGVLIGGALTAISWQWVFLVNIPLVILLLLLAARLVPQAGPRATGGVDLVGALAGTGGLCLLLFGVLSGGTSGWTSTTVLAELAVALALLALFVVRQLRAAAPLIPRMLFRLRNVVLGNAANAMVGGLLFGVFFVVTLHLQEVRDHSPIAAALRMVPISLFLFLGSQVAVRLIGRANAATVLAGGAALQAAALVWWALVLDQHDHIATSFLLPGVSWGFGSGVTIVAAFVVCTSGLHGPIMGAASGLVSTTLQVGGAVGVAMLGLVAARVAAARPELDAAQAITTGQAYAFGSAVLLALAGVAFMLWLRRSWQLPAAAEAGPGRELNHSTNTER